MIPLTNRIFLFQGDITKLEVAAIVNAANSSLMGGGDINDAIQLAVITSGGKLQAKYVIHTVGPIWCGGNNNDVKLLENAYINSLKLAIQNGSENYQIRQLYFK